MPFASPPVPFRSTAAWIGAWLLPALALAADPLPIDPLDWPHWRGPEMNGISRETGLVDTWSPKDDGGENLLWQSADLATRSTPIVMHGKIFTVTRAFPETKKEGEKVICADAATGKVLWENVHNVFLSDAPAERIGWSSPVGDPTTGRIYWLGLGSEFSCIDSATGETVWSHSMSEEYGMLSTYGGRTNMPTLFEDLIIVSGVMTGWDAYAVPAHRLVAFNKTTGEAVWIYSSGLRPPDTTYSTPILTTFKGQAAMVFGSSDGKVHAIQPRTGKLIWSYAASIRGLNQTPVIEKNVVYCGHSEEDADNPAVTGSFFALDGANKGKRMWTVPEVASGRSAPLLVDGKLHIVTDNANMFVLNPANGKVIGKQKLGTIMMGSTVYGDGKIYACEMTGRWYVLEPSAKGVKILSKGRLDNTELIASPIISHGRIYISSNDMMYCIGNADQQPAADPRPEVAAEAELTDMKPATALLSPVEALIKPGETVPYEVRLYNALGQFLKTAPADSYTLKGPGAVDDKGVLQVPAETGHAAVFVTAKVGELSATARVRVVPPLPWKFDFSDKDVPITWVGARYRHQFRAVDGEPLMVKITTIPLGTRSQCWMGPTDLHDYTIQADVRGAINNNKKPDIGLVNQRYTLDLMGVNKLQIRSWTSRLELRFAKEVDFDWKPDTWYTMKFQGANENGQAVLKGKVWPRGEEEPSTWTIEATDATPNTTGSPGLFGRSSDAEIFIDNVEVYQNK